MREREYDMRAFLALVLVTLVIGVYGVWSLWTAASEYNTTLRAYTRLYFTYQEDSFVWLEPDYSRARATLLIENESPTDAVVEDLNVILRFDGRFAGAHYDPIAPLTVPEGETRTVDLELRVTTEQIQEQGGRADLALTGSATVTFEGIEEDIVLDIRTPIGAVSRVE